MSSRRLTYFRVVDSCVYAVQGILASGFDSRQPYPWNRAGVEAQANGADFKGKSSGLQPPRAVGVASTGLPRAHNLPTTHSQLHINAVISGDEYSHFSPCMVA